MSTTYRKSYDVAGYTYAALILCPECAVGALTRARGAYDRNPENALDALAMRDHIDRTDESSYDSDEFPKVVFVEHLAEGETCESCGGEL